MTNIHANRRVKCDSYQTDRITKSDAAYEHKKRFKVFSKANTKIPCKLSILGKM